MAARPLAALALLLGGAGALAAEPTEPDVVLRLEVGEAVDLCGRVVPCPASAVSCEDAAVATVEARADAILVRGAAPGETRCGARGSNLIRKPFRVVVRARATPPR